MQESCRDAAGALTGGAGTVQQQHSTAQHEAEPYSTAATAGQQQPSQPTTRGPRLRSGAVCTRCLRLPPSNPHSSSRLGSAQGNRISSLAPASASGGFAHWMSAMTTSQPPSNPRKPPASFSLSCSIVGAGKRGQWGGEYAPGVDILCGSGRAVQREGERASRGRGRGQLGLMYRCRSNGKAQGQRNRPGNTQQRHWRLRHSSLTRADSSMPAAATRRAQRQKMTMCARARALQGWSAISMRSGCKW